MSFEIYCSDLVYYEHKSKLKNIFNSFGLKWKSDKSGWFNRGNSVVKSGLDNSDRLLVVSGSSDFVRLFLCRCFQPVLFLRLPGYRAFQVGWRRAWGQLIRPAKRDNV